VDDLERERTDLARQRNLLANERTHRAWLWTGLAAVVAGLGIAHLPDASGRLWNSPR
jgi:putative membrane protein